MSSGSYAVFISFVSPVLFFLQPFEGRRRRKVWLKNRQHGGRLVAILASRLRGPLYKYLQNYWTKVSNFREYPYSLPMLPGSRFLERFVEFENSRGPH